MSEKNECDYECQECDAVCPFQPRAEYRPMATAWQQQAIHFKAALEAAQKELVAEKARTNQMKEVLPGILAPLKFEASVARGECSRLSKELDKARSYIADERAKREAAEKERDAANREAQRMRAESEALWAAYDKMKLTIFKSPEPFDPGDVEIRYDVIKTIQVMDSCRRMKALTPQTSWVSERERAMEKVVEAAKRWSDGPHCRREVPEPEFEEAHDEYEAEVAAEEELINALLDYASLQHPKAEGDK